MSRKAEFLAAIKRATKGKQKMICIWASCKSVNVADTSCTITIDDLDIENIDLGTSKSGVIIFPTQGSNVQVLFNDHSLTGRVIDADQTDNIELMGNVNGGIPITANVVARLNNIENAYNDLVAKFDAHVHTGGTISGSTGAPTVPDTDTLTPTVNSDIENTKVKHGNG
jgi:hypothetical protein